MTYRSNVIFFKLKVTNKKPPQIRPTQVVTINNDSASASVSHDSDVASMQGNFEEELAWCIHKLKASLTDKNQNPKQGWI